MATMCQCNPTVLVKSGFTRQVMLHILQLGHLHHFLSIAVLDWSRNFSKILKKLKGPDSAHRANLAAQSRLAAIDPAPEQKVSEWPCVVNSSVSNRWTQGRRLILYSHLL